MKPKVGRNFTSERGEGVKGEVKNISLHWLQGIFETVPYPPPPNVRLARDDKVTVICNGTYL